MTDARSTTVLLTGASAGIGLAIARRLTADGYEVWGTSRETTRLPQLSRFHSVRMDLTRDESIRDGFSTAAREAGGFDVLINNAGAGVFGPTAAVSAELVHEQFQVLVHAPLELIRLVLPAMRQQRRGRILNITSLAAVFPIPFMGAYSAAKAALGSQTHCLRLELADSPIHVTEIQPGDINTGFHNATQRVVADEARSAAVWAAQQRTMAAAPPPERVAAAIAKVLHDPNPPPIVVVGGFGQARIAPLLARITPARWVEWGLRRFFGI